MRRVIIIGTGPAGVSARHVEQRTGQSFRVVGQHRIEVQAKPRQEDTFRPMNDEGQGRGGMGQDSVTAVVPCSDEPRQGKRGKAGVEGVRRSQLGGGESQYGRPGDHGRQTRTACSSLPNRQGCSRRQTKSRERGPEADRKLLPPPKIQGQRLKPPEPHRSIQTGHSPDLGPQHRALENLGNVG